MNELQDDIFELLKTLRKNGILEHLVLIGSWATLGYQEYFKGVEYHPVIRTTDIDFLIPKKPSERVQIDVAKILEGEGFLEEFASDGWVTFHKPEFHVEFLYPRVGPRSGDSIKVPQLGISVRPLRHMSLLSQNVIKVSFKGITLNMPHPAAYGLHKIIISTKRKKKEKTIKDLAAAREVLSALSQKDRQVLKKLHDNLTRNEKKTVSEVLKKDSQLQDILE